MPKCINIYTCTNVFFNSIKRKVPRKYMKYQHWVCSSLQEVNWQVQECVNNCSKSTRILVWRLQRDIVIEICVQILLSHHSLSSSYKFPLVSYLRDFNLLIEFQAPELAPWSCRKMKMLLSSSVGISRTSLSSMTLRAIQRNWLKSTSWQSIL